MTAIIDATDDGDCKSSMREYTQLLRWEGGAGGAVRKRVNCRHTIGEKLLLSNWHK